MPSLAELMLAFCGARGLTTVTLVGHSMGGNIALELTLLCPQLVSHLVLVDAASDMQLRVATEIDPALWNTYGWPALRLGQQIRRLMRPLGESIPHQHGGGLLRPFLRRQAIASTHDPEAQLALIAGLFSNPIGERAKLVQCPTLVVSGQFDSLVPAAASRRLAASIHGARYAEIPGAMHNPMDERPALFERVLLTFLAAGPLAVLP
jgi:pimeloyl-ACP methyl ester carboxylesterase